MRRRRLLGDSAELGGASRPAARYSARCADLSADRSADRYAVRYADRVSDLYADSFADSCTDSCIRISICSPSQRRGMPLQSFCWVAVGSHAAKQPAQ